MAAITSETGRIEWGMLKICFLMLKGFKVWLMVLNLFSLWREKIRKQAEK
jgi:hypothetical protein